MIRPANLKAASAQLMAYDKRYQAALVRQLEIAVSKLHAHAVQHAGYEDQTGNLKSSIGGTVLHNGIPVTYRGFTGGTENVGKETGLEYLNTIISSKGNRTGYGIILVAGMSYATYVENYNGRNVLKASELLALELVPKLVKQLKDAL